MLETIICAGHRRFAFVSLKGCTKVFGGISIMLLGGYIKSLLCGLNGVTGPTRLAIRFRQPGKTAPILAPAQVHRLLECRNRRRRVSSQFQNRRKVELKLDGTENQRYRFFQLFKRLVHAACLRQRPLIMVVCIGKFRVPVNRLLVR